MILEGPNAKCQSTRKPSAALTLTNVFTTATVDNISTTTRRRQRQLSSLHGTSISLIQHPTVEGEGVENARFKQRNVSA